MQEQERQSAPNGATDEGDGSQQGNEAPKPTKPEGVVDVLTDEGGALGLLDESRCPQKEDQHYHQDR